MKVKFPVVPTLYKIVVVVSLLVFFSILLVNHFVKMPIFEGLDASGSSVGTPMTDASGSSVGTTVKDASGPTTDASNSTITGGSTMVPKPNSPLTPSPNPSPADSSANIITNLQIAQEKAKTDKAEADAQIAQANAQTAVAKAQTAQAEAQASK
jgi:hypothetical protein